jgi:hypothetical protein
MAAQILPMDDAALVRPIATRMASLGFEVKLDFAADADATRDADLVLVAVAASHGSRAGGSSRSI